MNEPGVYTRAAHGVEMIIAIDSTRRGPALGGCRFKLYPDLDAAREDARALAAAMTYKAALARLKLGGGKAVIVGDPSAKTREQLLAFGDFVESLGGAYITAADMGTGQEEMAVIAERTRHVAGLPARAGGCGDPGPYTAHGVFAAMQGALGYRGASIEGCRVAIQGVGSVGAELARLVLAAGGRVLAADPREAQIRAAGALPSEVEWIAASEVATAACDVFAPCGPPGVIDRAIASRLRCGIVCGAANNPLRDERVAAQLEARDILYVPDFLANAGGLIHLAVALEGGDAAASMRHLCVIPENLDVVLARAKAEHVTPDAAARRIARENLSA